MTPDASDLRTAREGGPQAEAAFARLYDRHSPVVLALCRKQMGDGTEADDALQETFIRAFGMLERVTEDEGVRSWLYAIARHVCAERRRSSARRHKHETKAAELAMNASLTDHRVPVPDLPPGAKEHGQASATSAERAEQLRLLSRALDQLPDNERLAIHVYYLDADPMTAAQQVLGVSRSGFYKLLARARERLAAILCEARA
jgi:RNA polymerase sigma-70 factor (ECF subfamily)